MLRLTLDLVNFDYKKNSSVIKKFLRHVPKKEVFVSAVVGLAANKKKVKSFGVKKVCGTGGSLLYDTDVFISFGDCDYVNIAAFLVKKNIFSVCYKETKKTNCFDLTIDDDSLFRWKYINERYNRCIKKTEKKNINKRMKIAFVTPLAKKSAIAEYSVLTLKEFCKMADVDVYSLEKNYKNNFGAKNVFYLTPFPYLSNDYDAVITVVGDSPFHDKMLRFCMLYGGYTICHDANLLHYSYAEFGPQYLKNVSKFYHNKTVDDKDIMFYLQNFDKIQFTAIEPVIESSRVMFTHSKVFADSAKSSNVKYLPFCVHADIDTSKLNDAYKKQAKQELGFKETDIIITSFGNINKHQINIIW